MEWGSKTCISNEVSTGIHAAGPGITLLRTTTYTTDTWKINFPRTSELFKKQTKWSGRRTRRKRRRRRRWGSSAITIRHEFLPITTAKLHNRYMTVYAQMSQEKLFFLVESK